MLENDLINKQLYSDLMEQIKRLNGDCLSFRKSREYRIGRVISVTANGIKKMDLKSIKKNYGRWINGAGSSRRFPVSSTYNPSLDKIIPNYFSNDRIAVYTVVFGKYDSVPEPYCFPDNIDYYIITDQSIDTKKTKWMKKDISEFADVVKVLSNVEKNRFFKMHPHLVFPNYKYSIYIDGNIQVVSDLTEYIHRIGTPDISMHLHSSRSCAYDEAEAVIYAKKEKKENVYRHVKYLKRHGFPEHYGLLECNIIARRHTDLCSQLMDDWWYEFCKHSKRDQLSFPYVLYKNNISVNDVGTLGNNVFQNLSFRILTHK